jgi:hypothetical protein
MAYSDLQQKIETKESESIYLRKVKRECVHSNIKYDKYWNGNVWVDSYTCLGCGLYGNNEHTNTNNVVVYHMLRGLYEQGKGRCMKLI